MQLWRKEPCQMLYYSFPRARFPIRMLITIEPIAPDTKTVRLVYLLLCSDLIQVTLDNSATYGSQ